MTDTSGNLERQRALFARFWEARDIFSKVEGGSLYPRWIGSEDRFWYDRRVGDDWEFILFDARTAEKKVLCHRSDLMEALGRHAPSCEDGTITKVSVMEGSHELRFEARGSVWHYNPATEAIVQIHAAMGMNRSVSPDGTKEIWCADGNLLLRDLNSGATRPLTSDGEELNAYGVIPMPMRSLIEFSPQGRWSPDSRYFFTLQVDDRHVEKNYWIDYVPQTGHRPVLHSHPTPYPGDKPAQLRLLILDTLSGDQVTVDQYLHPTRMCDTPFGTNLAWWSQDGSTAYVAKHSDRERKLALLRIDPSTGETVTLFEEAADYPIALGTSLYSAALIYPLRQSNEVVWYSEKTGQAHLYLHCLRSGKELRSITSGDWRVIEVLEVIEERREAFIIAGGRDPNDPWLTRLCKISIDTGELTDLSEKFGLDYNGWRAGEHRLQSRLGLTGDNWDLVSAVSPSGEYVVQSAGCIDRMPEHFITDRNGKRKVLLEKGHYDLPTWWRWPKRMKFKADDGITDIYGLVWEPMARLDGKAPVIDIIYGAPQLAIVPKSAFVTDEVLDGFPNAAAFAATGAYAVLIDGRGVVGRERAFHDHVVGAIHQASDVKDHIAFIRQLAELDPAVDIDRVGITGFSGGGYGAANAKLRHPEFFKVAVACAGNYDQAVFWQTWGERYLGEYDPETYREQAVKTHARNLEGKLMLVHGLMDKGVHPAGMFQLLEALIAEDKDPDMIVIPSAAHEVNRYMWKRILIYFEEHLYGEFTEI